MEFTMKGKESERRAVTKGIATRSKKLLVAPDNTTRNRKLPGGGHRY